MRALLEHARHDPDRIERTKALEPDKAAINAAAELIIKSLLIGIDNAVSGNRFADEAEDIAELPFYEAVEYLRKKDVLPAKKYYELSDKARFRAFTLSRIADGDVMQRVKDMLAQNVSEGGGLGEFLKKTDEEIMQGCGLGGSGGGWYWENVYRTNVQTAYNAGRAIGYEAVPPIALELVGINDARQTAVCRRLTQPPVRRLYTDEFWRTHWPPFHFGCRTTVRAIYDAQELEEHPVTGVPDGEEPAKGFGRYPITSGSWWRELKSMAARAQKYGVQQEIARAEKLLIQSGGQSGGILDKDMSEQTRFAEEYYEAIRNRKSKSDIRHIAANTGFSEKDIAAVRSHVFTEKHSLDDGETYFAPDAEIALAWQRLEQGKHTELDILLLRHELEELTIMKTKGYDYDKAHLLADKKYPWEYKKRTEEYTDDYIQKDIERRLENLL